MPFVTVNNYAFYYEDDDFTEPWKPSRTLLIQHGFGRNSQFWHHWIPLLGKDFRIVRVDLRGHGRSEDPGPDHEWSFDELVSDLEGILYALGLDTIDLLAESTGGMIAVGFAARHPDRLRSLTLCASPTTIGPAAQQRFAGAYPDWQTALQELGAEGWARWLLEARPLPDGGRAQVEWAVGEWARSATHALIGYSRVISETDVTALLPLVKAPTLLLAPTKSLSATPEDQLRIAGLIEDAELVWIDGAGHEIYIDKAHACSNALRGFLLARAGASPA